MSMDLPEDVVGVLLAGGRSSRMGGPPIEIGGREVDPFLNINRPQDLAEAEMLWNAAGA